MHTTDSCIFNLFVSLCACVDIEVCVCVCVFVSVCVVSSSSVLNVTRLVHACNTSPFVSQQLLQEVEEVHGQSFVTYSWCPNITHALKSHS